MEEFVKICAVFHVEPLVARNTLGRRTNIPDALAESAEYQAGQVVRKRVEQIFGWMKTVAGLDKARHRGLKKVDWQFTLVQSGPVAETAGSVVVKQKDRVYIRQSGSATSVASQILVAARKPANSVIIE